MYTYIIYVICGLTVGLLIGLLHGRNSQKALQTTLNEAETEKVRLQTASEVMHQQHAREIEQLKNSYQEQLKAERNQASELIQTERENTRKLIQTEQEKAASLLNSERENFEKLLQTEQEKATKLMAAEQENRTHQLNVLKEGFEKERNALKAINEQYKRSEEEMREKTELLKKEFQNLANQILEDKSSALKSTNKEQLEAVLVPLKENIEKLGKSVQDNRITSTQYKESIEHAIKGLLEKTEKIGNDAVNLTKALKANPKIQGDWGEMILERILEESGLRKGEEYYAQENCVTDDGRNVRPDMIVRFPENRSIVIDSKVSLTAYVNYICAESEPEKRQALAAHINSVRDHIKELSEKDYSKVVNDSIGYVLMFIPNEGSYIAAVEQDKELLNFAYKRRIIVISPSNLMMALQLAYNLWQSERQSRNVEEIIRTGSNLYDKFVTFVNTFEKLGDRLDDARKQYDAALGTLAKGRGNLIGGMGKMKQLGLTPKKEISAVMQSKVEELLPES